MWLLPCPRVWVWPLSSPITGGANDATRLLPLWGPDLRQENSLTIMLIKWNCSLKRSREKWNANTYPWRGWGCTKEPSLCWLPASLLDNLGPNWDADWSAVFPNKEKGRECCCCQLWFCGSVLVKLWEFSISADGCPPPKLVWWRGNVLFSGTESTELEGGVACIAWGYPCSAK